MDGRQQPLSAAQFPDTARLSHGLKESAARPACAAGGAWRMDGRLPPHVHGARRCSWAAAGAKPPAAGGGCDSQRQEEEDVAARNARHLPVPQRAPRPHVRHLAKKRCGSKDAVCLEESYRLGLRQKAARYLDALGSIDRAAVTPKPFEFFLAGPGWSLEDMAQAPLLVSPEPQLSHRMLAEFRARFRPTFN